MVFAGQRVTFATPLEASVAGFLSLEPMPSTLSRTRVAFMLLAAACASDDLKDSSNAAVGDSAGADPLDAQPVNLQPKTATAVLPGRVVDIQGGEFFFRSPDTIPAGLTTFRLHQIGMAMDSARAGATGRALVSHPDDGTRGFHTLAVVRLDSGKTVADLYRSAQAGDRVPAWVKAFGGPGFAVPPRTTNATLDLEPGNYALVCYTGSAQDDQTRYHFLKGMYRAITVIPNDKPRAAAPLADVVARITGNGVVQFSSPITTGSVVLRVENATEKTYEFKIHQVPRAMTGKEFLENPSTGPSTPWGGLSEVPPGRSVVTTIDFEPGEYVVGMRPPIRHATSRVIVVSAPRE